MDDETKILVTLENHGSRIGTLEDRMKEYGSILASVQSLTLSVNKLAINMESMLAEQKDQGSRIKALESEPAEQWNSVKKTVLTVIISTLAGACATGLIVLIAQSI